MQVKSRIICPKCRAQSAVPAGGVKELPANFHINSMMDELGLKREVQKCNECVKDEPVVAYCQTCSSNLCQFCCENHKRSKRFNDHKTVLVAKLRSNKDVSIQPKAISLTCKDHNIELLFYCETCEQLVCKCCVVKRHRNHNYSNVRIQTCKCQIKLEAIAPPKTHLSEAHDTIDEMKKVRYYELFSLIVIIWKDIKHPDILRIFLRICCICHHYICSDQNIYVCPFT